MKASTFSNSQKAFFLKQAAYAALMAEICQRASVSEATYLNWKKEGDGLSPRRY